MSGDSNQVSLARSQRELTFPPAESFFPRRRYNAGEPLCFLHAMKTGGTTVRLIMENAFDGARVFPSGSAAYAGGYLPLDQALAAGDDLSAFQALSGHYGLQIASRLSPRTNFFTWLREPVDRTVSHFFFSVVQMRTKNFESFFRRLDHGERLETVFLDWVSQSFPLPHQVVVNGNYGNRWNEANSHTQMHGFATDLLHRCFFLGLIEDHERSLDGLCALTSILPPKQSFKRNAGTERRVLSLTTKERVRLEGFLGPDIAFYKRAAEVYKLQMGDLRERTNENPAFGLIGDREALRSHILRSTSTKVRLQQWRAWDPVQAENLDTREEHREGDGSVSRWRWTGSSPDTYLYFETPRDAFQIRIRLNPATPVENVLNAKLKFAGLGVNLKYESAPAGRHDLVGTVNGRTVRRLPEIVEFHIHTPAMLDESQFGPTVGSRMLGLAIESISAEPVQKETMVQAVKRWFRIGREQVS